MVLTQSYRSAHLLSIVWNLTSRKVSYQDHGYCICLDTDRLLADILQAQKLQGRKSHDEIQVEQIILTIARKRDHGINKELEGSMIIIVRIVHIIE